MRFKNVRISRRALFSIVALCTAQASAAEILTLQEAIRLSETQNRAIRAADLDRAKARIEVGIARTYRLPVLSVWALGSQSLSKLGLTLEQGSLGVYPGVGPIPGRTTTLESPLKPGAIIYASFAQPLTQQHKIGLGIRLARIGVEAAEEQLRSKRQSTRDEVRRLYYSILQLQSNSKSLDATVAFLKRLDFEVAEDVLQRVALRGDSLDVKAQLAQAEYGLLKLANPLETQKQELNRLMGRDPDTEFDVDLLAAADFILPA